MLYYFFKYLDKLDFPGAGIFQYITFRSACAIILSLILATVIGKKVIKILQKQQIGEDIRDLGLEGQMQKKGTPTMGGIIILLSILIPVLLFARLDNVYIQLMIISTLWLGAIGFADDYIKVFRRHKEGLKGRFKVIGQVGLGLIVGITLYASDDVVIREKVSAAPASEPDTRLRFLPVKRTVSKRKSVAMHRKRDPKSPTINSFGLNSA